MHVIRAGGATLQNPPVFVDRKAAAKGSGKLVVSNSETLKEIELRNLPLTSVDPLTIPFLPEMGGGNHPQLKVSDIGFAA